MHEGSTLISNLVNDPEFRQAEKDWFSFVEKISEKLSEIDDTVPELPVKDVVGLNLTVTPLHDIPDDDMHRSSVYTGMSDFRKVGLLLKQVFVIKQR